MTPRDLPAIIPVLLALLILAPSAGAAVVLSGVSFSPEAPLSPGGQQKVVATYAVIPSGATTFANGHSLQMQTDLAGAQWIIQVTLDGRDAARQTATGSAAFVNGEILSYSTSRDVGLVVTVDGTVPQGATGQVMVLQVKELDNSGTAIYGSVTAISQPVAGPAPAPVTSVLPTRTPSSPTTPAPGKSPGFGVPVVIAVLVASVLIVRGMVQRRQ